MQRIGILGGTFDPIHYGHLAMARYCLQSCKLDRVMFLPVGNAPHKSDLTPAELRFAMILRAIADDPLFFASDMELKRPGKTYTYDTLTELHRQEPEASFFYIIGADAVNKLPLWYRAEEVFGMTEFIVIDRAGYRPDHQIPCRMGARLHLTARSVSDISSTAVRQAVQRGDDIGSMVPPCVKEIIEQNGLYLH